MPRLAARKDLNHDEIRSAFERLGWYWRDTFQLGQGFPDGVASREGINLLVEVKSNGGKLSCMEAAYHQACPGPIVIVRSVDDVIAIDAQYRCGQWTG